MLEKKLGASSITIGDEAMEEGGIGPYTIAIGYRAGRTSPAGSYNVFIGALAGYQKNSCTKSIVLNATGANLNPIEGQNSSFYVKPIRNASADYGLFYNNTTGEISYDTAASGGSSLWGEHTSTDSFGVTSTTVKPSNGMLLELNNGRIKTATNSIYIGNGWNVAPAHNTDILYNVAVGKSISEHAGSGQGSVAIGWWTGQYGMFGASIAIGIRAANSGAAQDTVYIGGNAGRINKQNYASVFIGYKAGYGNTSLPVNVSDVVCIGRNAGASFNAGQKLSKGFIALGGSAGEMGGGESSIAIGYKAMQKVGNVNNTILLNATGKTFDPTAGQHDCFYVKPIRNAGKTEPVMRLQKNWQWIIL